MSCFAYTARDPVYPAYLNIRVEDGHVIATIRSAPNIRQGGYVCAYERRHGNCQPGSQHCNNYCNLHPNEDMPMADRPLPCTHVDEGTQSMIRIPVADWTAMGLPLPPA